MIQSTSKFLKWLYSLTSVAMIYPAGVMGASGWVGMATGGGVLGNAPFVELVIVCGLIFRVIQVVFRANALDVYVGGAFVKLLRVSAMFLMGTGLLAVTLMLFVKPLTSAILGQSDDGVTFFAVGVYLYFFSLIGFPGLILFEIARMLAKLTKPREEKFS